MGEGQSQKAWLSNARKRLSTTHPGLTWDAFADLLGADTDVFKKYRVSPNSASFLPLPTHVKASIDSLLEDLSEHETPRPKQAETSELLIPALAALVVRKARASLIDRSMVAGISKVPGIPIGLTQEDRAAMALVSRTCLSNGLTDHGAEIHDLFWHCSMPFESWLNVPEVRAAGLGRTNLIHGEDGIPTVEAEELAQKFTGMSAGLEEQLFLKFIELLSKQPASVANEYYTLTREFVIRHPVCTSEELRKFGNEIHLQIWMLLNQEFYEPVPESWEINGSVPLCSHCCNAMKQGKAGLVCRTAACAISNPAMRGSSAKASDILRVNRGIRQYWIEPGLDEIRLFDALSGMDLCAELYPYRDRVDISVGEVGIDLKSYSSPETLGRKFKSSIGGLVHYEFKLLVIPDWVQKATPSYLERLKFAMERKDIICLTVSQAIAYFEKDEARA